MVQVASHCHRAKTREEFFGPKKTQIFPCNFRGNKKRQQVYEDDNHHDVS